MMRVLFTVILAFGMAAAMTVDETDSDVLYVNFPVPADKVRALTHPAFTIDEFDGHAWATAMILNLDSVKWVSPVGKIPIGGGGSLLKITTYGSYKGTPGYIFHSLDFPKSFTGWIQKLGCSGTQPGVKCGAASFKRSGQAQPQVERVDSVTSHYDKKKILTRVFYRITPDHEDPKFVDFIVNRPSKLMQDGTKGAFFGPQQEKDTPQNKDAYKVEIIESAVTEIIKYHTGLDVEAASIRAFWSNNLHFIDNDASKVA